MKTLEKGQEKIKKISDQLRRETLEPAQEEARKIIEEAKIRADEIIAEAEKQTEVIFAEARKAIEQERNVFESSLQQATKQSLESLRQSIEHRLFNEQLHQIISKQASEPNVIAKLITAIINAIEKEGLSADLAAIVPKHVSAKEVNHLLTEEVLKKLKEHSVVLGDFAGGIQIKLLDKNLMIDISDEALKDLVSHYVRKDFRKLIFAS